MMTFPRAAPTPAVVRMIFIAGLWPAAEQRLETRNGVGEEWRMISALHRKSKGSVQLWQLIGAESPGLPFPEANSCYPLSLLNLIVQRYGVTPKVQSPGKRFQLLPGGLID
jgi:hypothetical protein